MMLMNLAIFFSDNNHNNHDDVDDLSDIFSDNHQNNHNDSKRRSPQSEGGGDSG